MVLLKRCNPDLVLFSLPSPREDLVNLYRFFSPTQPPILRVFLVWYRPRSQKTTRSNYTSFFEEQRSDIEKPFDLFTSSPRSILGRRTLPLSLRLGKLTRFGRRAVNIFVEPEYTAIHEDIIPVPEWSVRLGINFLFPDGF